MFTRMGLCPLACSMYLIRTKTWTNKDGKNGHANKHVRCAGKCNNEATENKIYTN